MAFDAVSIGVEGDALAGDGGIELGESVDVPVGDGLVEVGPQRLGRLELGGAEPAPDLIRGWWVDEAEAVGHREAGDAVPAGVVEHEHDDAVAPGAGLAGEEGQHVLEVARGTMPVERWPAALAGGGRDEGGDVEPLEAVMAGRDGALPARRPDAAPRPGAGPA